MADHKRAANIADAVEQYDSPAFFRLGVWGLCAVLALTTTVFAARSELGAKRITAAVAAITASPDDPPSAMIDQILTRIVDMERETRRLTDVLRSLTAERERLTSRLGMVEREMGDLTGSINRSLVQQPSMFASKPELSGPVTAAAGAPHKSRQSAPPTGPATQPVAGDIQAKEAAIAEPAAQAYAAEPVPLPQPRPSQQATAPAVAEPIRVAVVRTGGPSTPVADSSSTTAPPTASEHKGVEEPQPKAELGIDLGPGLTMAKLRARWNAFKAAHADIAEGLQPVISIRELGQNKPVEMRLVVGPVPNVYAASQICAALVGTQFACHPAVFDGQRLALR